METFCRKQNELKMVTGRSLDLILSLTAITDDSSGLGLKTANDALIVRNLKCIYKLWAEVSIYVARLKYDGSVNLCGHFQQIQSSFVGRVAQSV